MYFYTLLILFFKVCTYDSTRTDSAASFDLQHTGGLLHYHTGVDLSNIHSKEVCVKCAPFVTDSLTHYTSRYCRIGDGIIALKGNITCWQNDIRVAAGTCCQIASNFPLRVKRCTGALRRRGPHARCCSTPC